MRLLMRLWFGFGALWIALILAWVMVANVDDDGRRLLFWVIGVAPVALVGAVLSIFRWASRS